MLIGAMNNPERPVMEEIELLASTGAEFIDLTLEPPGASSWDIKIDQLRNLLNRLSLPVVGHTAYYLPIASPFPELRKAAVAEICRCVALFAQLGARWVNVHPQTNSPFHSRAQIVDDNIRSLHELLDCAARQQLGLMLENVPGGYNTVPELKEVFERLPELGLHLDIGHANLQVHRSSALEMIRSYGSRIKHVHLHDNKGGSLDLHLPLGAGTIDYETPLRLLKENGYDGTITLEVFSPEKHYFDYSKTLVQQVWNR